MRKYELWECLPDMYRFDDPEQIITSWRGDKIGRMATGMTCTQKDGDPVETVIAASKKGGRELFQLVDGHTSGYGDSPLVSLTSDLRIAQSFASRQGETIYEIEIPAYRLVRKPERVSYPRLLQNREFFAVGFVSASEILRSKVNNDELTASELNYEDTTGKYRYWPFDHPLDLAPLTTPNSLGVWE